MKSEKGITLTSLIIYIIGLTIVITLASTFSGYFLRNVNDIVISQSAQEEYSRFLSYLTKDVNSNDITFVQSEVKNEDCIIFKFENNIQHQYILKNEKIYYINIDKEKEEKIILCNNVTVSSQKAFKYESGNIDINFNIKKQEFSSSLNVKS